MKLQMYAKWAELGNWTPGLRIDRYRWLCALAGVGTVAFEVSFLPLVFFRRRRPWLIIAGLTFHNFTGLLMRIWFLPLQAMYVALVNWDPLFRLVAPRLSARMRPDNNRAAADAPPSDTTPGTHSSRNIAPIVLVGAVLFLIETCLGLSHISEAWPFASYPAFDFRASAQRQVLTLAVETENGQFMELKRTTLNGHLPSDRERGLEESLLCVKEPALRNLRLRAFWQLWVENHPELRHARSVRFYEDTLTTLPEQQERRLRRELLLTLALDV